MKESFAVWKDNLKKEYRRITWQGKKKVATETGIVIAV